jgi:hypothetical protein
MTQVYSPRRIRESAKTAKQLFEKIDPQLRAQHHGKFIAIDADSGEYFLGDTIVEADKHARAKHPGKVFYVGRIGYPAAIKFHGHVPIGCRSRR